MKNKIKRYEDYTREELERMSWTEREKLEVNYQIRKRN